jgi:hypothetical protein
MKTASILIITVLFFTTVSVNVISNSLKNNNENNILQTTKMGKVTITLEEYDEDKQDFIKETINEISLDEAKKIKNKLSEIENNYKSEEKIRNQIELLQEYNLLPSYINLDDYFTVLGKMKQYFYNTNNKPLKISPGLIFSGPSIQSTLALGGQTYQLETIFGDILQYYFDTSIFEFQTDDLFNGTHLHSSAYAGPVYVGFSPSSAFITTLGTVFSGPKIVYSPFISIRVVFAGTHLSATIFECENPITIFDWHLNVAFLGVVLYQGSVEPAIPQNIQGPSKGKTNINYSFSTSTVDMEGDEIYYKFEWGDGTDGNWIGPFDNFEIIKKTHQFKKPGDYFLRVKARDNNYYESDWSEPLLIKISKEKSNKLNNNDFVLNRIIGKLPIFNNIRFQLFYNHFSYNF